jgi:tRNA(Ile)-lysidine synthase
MPSLADRVARTIREHALLAPDARVLIAVSAGADSVALAHLLCDLGPALAFSVAGVAHFNHRLRAAAEDDERFASEVAARLGLPFVAGGSDVRALARERRVSIEDAARQLRYDFLESARFRLGADRTAVGHTRDDQAETVLLRLLRGAGTRGLAAIRPRSGHVIRPLLDVARAELRGWLNERELAFREDESNLDLAVPRNRIRHELLPYLERFSPGVAAVLAREADLAREDEAVLAHAAADAARDVVTSAEGATSLDREALLALPRGLARRVVRGVLESCSGRFIGLDHVGAVLELAAGEPGRRLSLPGLSAARRADRIVLEPRTVRPAAAQPPAMLPRPLPIPGEVVLPEAGWAISAGTSGGRAVPGDLAGDGPAVAVSGESLMAGLAVRFRRPGDALRPLGLGGRKKLQDLFVDRKIPRGERDAVPLVVDAGDRIVWVVGHAVAEDFQVTSPERGVIILKARRLGGQA